MQRAQVDDFDLLDGGLARKGQAVRRRRRRTLVSMLVKNRACIREITGLSNQALSSPATKPLEEALEARPRVMTLFSRSNLIRRSGNRNSGSEESTTERLSVTDGIDGMSALGDRNTRWAAGAGLDAEREQTTNLLWGDRPEGSCCF